MKGLFLSAASGVVCVSVCAQGALDFANSGPGLQAQVYDMNLTPLSGPAWAADLYWAAGVVANSIELVPLNAPSTFSTVPAQAGLFFGGPRTITGVSGGATITAQIRVWNTASGSSWAAAIASGNPAIQIGQSVLFQVTLADPTNTPAIMTNLNGHSWQTSSGPLDAPLGVNDAGVRTNQFGFNIYGSGGGQVVVLTSTNLTNWTRFQTNFTSNLGPVYFTDPQWTNYPGRFYMVKWL
jgi:hypothetical protein